MKNGKFPLVSTALAKYSFLSSIVFFSIFVALLSPFAYLRYGIWGALQIILLFVVIGVGVNIVLQRRAYFTVRITDLGISNGKHHFLSWSKLDEIYDYKVYPIVLYKYTLFIKPRALPSVIGIGERLPRFFIGGGGKNNVYFSLDERTLELLHLYGKNKSKFVDEILNRFDS